MQMIIENTKLLLAARIVLPIFGGYALASGFAGFFGVLLSFAGMARSEAVLLAAMLSFLVYLLVLIWGFAERRVFALLAGFVLSPAVLIVMTMALGDAFLSG